MPDAHGITAVLIHGAWAGGWVWDTITPYLEARGFRVLAPDLPVAVRVSVILKTPH